MIKRNEAVILLELKLQYESGRGGNLSRDAEIVQRRQKAGRSFLRAAMFEDGSRGDVGPVGSLFRGQQRKHAFYDTEDCQQEIARQLNFIWEKSADLGLVIEYEALNAWSSQFDQEAGSEHVAVLVPNEGRVYKRTIGSLNGELFGVEKLPIPYLLNQGLISVLFETGTRFEGISRRPVENTTEFLISQKFIRAADVRSPYPSEEKIDEFFSKEGFKSEPVESSVNRYVNDALGLAIVDSHPGNFIDTEAGIKPFDIHFEIMREESIAAVAALIS